MRAADRVEVNPGIPFTLVFMWSIAIQLTGSIVGLTAFARLLTGPLLPSRQRLQDVRKDFELTRKADPASEARRIADTALPAIFRRGWTRPHHTRHSAPSA